jgi:hydroxymethylglutaryl-CoA lyase
MTSAPSAVTVVEVGPRDGLQNEAGIVATDVKVELVDRLSQTGLRHVEVTSFVSPKAVPQLADGADVMARIDRRHDVTYPVLVPNLRGYDAARSAGATSISVFTAASEAFNRRNIGATIAESIERYRIVVDQAHADGVHVRGYVSMAFGSPWEGPVDPLAVASVVEQLADLGIVDVSIGDTIGVAVPADVERVMSPLLELDADLHYALHLHDTRGTALANVVAGLELGIDTFDSSIAGLGGCPFAPGATGNLATEDLVWLLHQQGIETGVSLPALVEVSTWISEAVGRPIQGHVARSSLWPWGVTSDD